MKKEKNANQSENSALRVTDAACGRMKPRRRPERERERNRKRRSIALSEWTVREEGTENEEAPCRGNLSDATVDARIPRERVPSLSFVRPSVCRRITRTSLAREKPLYARNLAHRNPCTAEEIPRRAGCTFVVRNCEVYEARRCTAGAARHVLSRNSANFTSVADRAPSSKLCSLPSFSLFNCNGRSSRI